MKEKKVTFISKKHDGLILWNGNHKIQFVRNKVATSDKREIAFLREVVKSKPQYQIIETNPNRRVRLVEYEVDEEGREHPVIPKEDQQEDQSQSKDEKPAAKGGKNKESKS